MEFINSWRIRSPVFNGYSYVRPQVVYRYMNQKYIDAFFEDGTIKLSSFTSNGGKLSEVGVNVRTSLFGSTQLIKEDIRNDPKEGSHNYIIYSRNRKLKISRRVEDVLDCTRMFCTSKQLDLKFYLSRFNVDGCMKITNSTMFGFEIAKVLQGYKWGEEGQVNYINGEYSNLMLEQYPELPDFSSLDLTLEQELIYLDFIGRMDRGKFFYKNLKFKDECEYRFNWNCNSNHDFYIKCPGALKYCKKVT